MLPSHDNLVNNGKPQFGQFAAVNTINFLDAKITKPNGMPLSLAEKKRKANQFCFIGIQHERYIVGLAVTNLKSVSNFFVYVYDKITKEITEINKINPLGASTHMSNRPNEGSIRFRQGLSHVEMIFSKTCIELTVNLSHINITAEITPSKQPMCLCTRTGYTGWVYMQKQTALACKGSMTLYGKQSVFTTENCRAGIDWTLGYMTRETFWNWASINTQLNASQTLGLNLVCGVNDTSYTENAVWLNDQCHNLPLTIFDYDPHDVMQPWHIHSNTQVPTDRHVDLTFTPLGRRDDHTDLKLLASHFSQLIGTYSGTITLPDHTLTLDNVWGLAEDHYARW